MKKFISTGRMFYSLALIIYGIQQFVYGDFRNVFFPPWQQHLPLLIVWAYLFGLYLIASAILIITGKNAQNAALILGGAFLFLFCFLHIPYELISEPNKTYHFGLWVNPLKELALSGGAFVIAGSFRSENMPELHRSIFLKTLDKIAPYGNIFFAFTMTGFGIGHFMYVQFVSKTVPSWMPDPVFWTCFAGVALMAGGICILLNIRLKIIALFLSLMIFLWFWLLHLPGVFSYQGDDRRNILASAFDALAFSGIALVIAFTLKRQKWIEDIENYE
jgi:uncharacterized membrane protein YphA (DoxX/SURF4 family)